MARALAAARFSRYVVFYLYLSVACGIAGSFAFQLRGGLSGGGLSFAFAAVVIWTTAAYFGAFGVPPRIAPVGVTESFLWGFVATCLLLAKQPYNLLLVTVAAALIAVRLFAIRPEKT